MPAKFSPFITNESTYDTAIEEAPTPNRRIGERHETSLPVDVKPLGQRKRRAFRPRDRASLTNVSVSGAAITCRSIRGVQMYSMLEIEGDAGCAVVRVQRISALDTGEVEYGVELVDADVAMRRVFFGALPNSDTNDDWRWLAAE